MSIFEYDEEAVRRALKEESYEEGMADGKKEDILDFLSDKGVVPEEVREEIMAQEEIEVLRRWLKLAAGAGNIEEFMDKK